MHRALPLLLLPLLASGTAASGQEAAGRADHHVHLLSPRLIADWKSLGVPFRHPDDHYADIDIVLGRTGADRAALVSMAHLYASAWFARLPHVRTQELELVRAENDFIAAAVARHPERLAGFFSLNPRRDYFRAECARSRALPGMVGLKLHLPACGLDLTNPEHARLLADAFSWCATSGTAVLIHLYAGHEAPEQAAIFWSLVAPHPDLQLIVAHTGGSGGYDPRARALLEGYAALRDNDARFRDAPVFFDLSGGILTEAVEGRAATTDADARAFAEIVRAIGLERFVFATDYPVFSTDGVLRGLRERAGLTDAELARIRSNHAPVLRPQPAATAPD